MRVTYSATPAQLKAVVKDIQLSIDNHPNTNKEEKVCFHEFGPSSLDIMVLFFVDTIDWTTYFDVKEEIIQIANRCGATIAFPFSSVYMEKNINPSAS